MLASGGAVAVQRRPRAVARSHPPRVRRRHARRRASTCSASCRSSSSASASGCSRTPSTASASSARSTCRFADRRCSSATTCRTSTALLVGRVRAALHPLPRLPAVLRALGVPSAAEADERDSDRRRARGAGVARSRAARAAERPRRLHLRGRRDQPDRQHAAVQARVRADRRRPGRADHSGLPRSRVGQHLQLQGRAVLLEVAGARSVSGDRRLRRAAAVDDDGRRSAARAADARLRPRDASAGPRTKRSARQFVRTAKHHWWSFSMADATTPSR